MKLLLARNANIEAKTSDGITPLILATLHSKEMVELLLSSNANINAKSRSGWTALHMATQNGDLEIAKLLVASGASVNAYSQEVGTPLKVTLDAAKKAGFDNDPEKNKLCLEIAKFLRQHAAKE